MSLAQLHQLLQQAEARRLERSVPVFELQAPWWPFSRRARHLETLRVHILSVAMALPGPTYLVCDENPQAYDVGGPWAHAADDTWSLPPSCAPADLQQRLLPTGDWTLYCALRPVARDTLPDLFDVPPGETADFATGAGMPFLAQAFHDNDPWRLFVDAVSAQGRAAA